MSRGAVDLATLMFVSYRAMDERVGAAMRAAGYDVTAAQARLAQRLDQQGLRLTDLAERAQVTKQAMAELVHYLEARGYVTRVPDPTDRRAKLVLPTDRGKEVLAIAQQLIPELEERVSNIVGADRVQALKADLDAIRHNVTA